MRPPEGDVRPALARVRGATVVLDEMGEGGAREDCQTATNPPLLTCGIHPSSVWVMTVGESNHAVSTW